MSKLNQKWVVSNPELTEWSMVKHNNRPTLTGSPKWQTYMQFLEDGLRRNGCVDFFRNSWTFDRWYTSDALPSENGEEPSKWSLDVDGQPVRLAHYGAYSGSTGPEGVTAELVWVDPDDPPKSLVGKIAVVKTKAEEAKPPYTEEFLCYSTFGDYEYRTDEAWAPMFEKVDPSFSITFETMHHLEQQFHEMVMERGAVGMVKIIDMPYDRCEGLYTFPVPNHHPMPWVTVGREDGIQLEADARVGKIATLRLEATIEPAEAYQLICFLPGKHYGTAQDEQILLINHTDGPSITQDNGALGLLGIVQYFGHLPQNERNRTLFLLLDCRHYIPGMEGAHKEVSYLMRYPEARKKIVGMIQIEHLGEMDWRDEDGKTVPVGLPEQSYLWCRNNQNLIDHAIDAVKRHRFQRAQVVCPERPGIHGDIQQWWWGVGVTCLPTTAICTFSTWTHHHNQLPLDVPGYGMGSFLGYYWTTASGIERWNCEHALSQIKTMIELTGVLMTSDLEDIKPEPISDWSVAKWYIDRG